MPIKLEQSESGTSKVHTQLNHDGAVGEIEMNANEDAAAASCLTFFILMAGLEAINFNLGPRLNISPEWRIPIFVAANLVEAFLSGTIGLVAGNEQRKARSK